MLKGYTVPLSPKGQAALAPPPPWHYSSDVLAVEFWADPDAVTALLPPGMKLDTEAQGHAFAMFLDWQFTGSNDEIFDPARYQYRETFLLVDALWDHKKVTYCPFIYVDNDSAIARGWAQGYPKKLGTTFQTRSFAAPSAAACPLAPGSKFGASLSAHGERLVDARVVLREAVSDPTTVFNRPTTMRRYFPQLDATRQDKPAVDELTLSLVDDLHIVDLWSGDAELRIPDVRGEELHTLKPVRVGKGYRYSMSYTVTDLKILRDYTR